MRVRGLLSLIHKNLLYINKNIHASGKMAKIKKTTHHNGNSFVVQENQWETKIKRGGELTLNLRDKSTKQFSLVE